MTRAILPILATCILSCTAQVLLRAGASRSGSNDLISILANWRVACGILLFTLSTLLWIVVLSRTPLSYAYLVASVNYVLIPIASHFILRESLNLGKLAGMALIVAGILVMASNTSARPGHKSNMPTQNCRHGTRDHLHNSIGNRK